MTDETNVDIAILTVLPEEYKAMHDRLIEPGPAPSFTSAPDLYAWVIGKVPYKDSQAFYSVALGMIGRAGTSQGALATKDAIARWRPRYILFVGIAGGFELNHLVVGDVVIADVICGYEYGKLEEEFVPRSDWTYRTDLALMNCAVAFSTVSSHWLSDIGVGKPDGSVPKVVVGQVASGDKVVDDPTSSFFAKVKQAWPKLQAVEMEGVGAAKAIEEAQSSGAAIDFLMIRGISDMPRPQIEAEGKGTEERDSWKEYASNAAAAFTVAFIANRFPLPPNEIAQKDDGKAQILPADRLATFGLHDESHEAFGKTEFTAGLTFIRRDESVSPALHYVIIAALPIDRVVASTTDILKTAREMLETRVWYSSSKSADHPPKYWPHSIFEVPTTRRSASNAFVWERRIRAPANDPVASRLAITGFAEVAFAAATPLVYMVREEIPVFRLGMILARCWQLSGLVAQLHQDIGYVGKTCLCIGMVSTSGSHLGAFADRWLEPSGRAYWSDFELEYASGIDRRCHSPNLRFCEVVELLNMKPKQQPKFINQFGEAISLRYNHDAPRCFEEGTGLIPERYFR